MMYIGLHHSIFFTFQSQFNLEGFTYKVKKKELFKNLKPLRGYTDRLTTDVLAVAPQWSLVKYRLPLSVFDGIFIAHSSCF